MNALIFVAQGVQDQEFWYPYYRLQEAGFEINIVVSGKERNITGKYGIPIKGHWLTSEFKAFDFRYDITIIPGGWQAPEIMRQDKVILEYLQKIDNKSLPIAAICHGPQVLISAGICKDVKMTCYKGMKDDLINAGATYVDKSVVRDGNIITAQHYNDNPLFMKTILRHLN